MWHCIVLHFKMKNEVRMSEVCELQTLAQMYEKFFYDLYSFACIAERS